MLGVCLAVILALYILFKVELKKLAARDETSKIEQKTLEDRIGNLISQNEGYEKKINLLKKYERIEDAKAEARRIIKNASREAKQTIKVANKKVDIATAKCQEIDRESKIKIKTAEIKAAKIIEEAENISTSALRDARYKAKLIIQKSENTMNKAFQQASEIEASANIKAQEIAGDAWEAKNNSDKYTAIEKAMRNIIKGYGDEYLVPARSVVDLLAEEYAHKEAGKELARLQHLIKAMIKHGEAAESLYSETHRRETAIKFILDAFIGKVDSIMSKVRYDNYGKLLQQLKDAFQLVNHNGKAFRDTHIKDRFFRTVVERLKMAVAVQELRKIDIEEQRQIKQAMREEELARREYEKARKQAEKEEKMFQAAIKEAQKNLAIANLEEREKYKTQIVELTQRLHDAEEKGKRAISMAQQTKRGHVYIISNIGSFGENVYKIGLTRRLEPLDRVKELGNASVPFSFDVHAMIYSEDAPKLEKFLHRKFKSYQVNRLNPRKEFFRVSLSMIKHSVIELDMMTDIHWTMRAGAQEYRETLQIEHTQNECPKPEASLTDYD